MSNNTQWLYGVYPAQLTPTDRQTVTAITEYMQQHFTDSITLQEVAAHFGYETCYFSKLFKRLMGVTFLQYRTNMRIAQASVLLLRTNKSIMEIVGCCGFSTVRNFNRVFREITGKTPSELRSYRMGIAPDCVKTALV